MKKVVVADDDMDVRLLFQEVLLQEGYEVVTVASGREAVDEVAKDSPALLILDIKMPGMHGLEVLDKVRQLTKGLPVIICSAYKHMNTDPAVLEADVKAYLVKPVDLNELRAKVREAIGD